MCNTIKTIVQNVFYNLNMYDNDIIIILIDYINYN